MHASFRVALRLIFFSIPLSQQGARILNVVFSHLEIRTQRGGEKKMAIMAIQVKSCSKEKKRKRMLRNRGGGGEYEGNK